MNFEVHLRKGPDCLEETTGRNMDVKGDCGEGSEKIEQSTRESFYHPGEYICMMTRMLLQMCM